jgi:hypothetical protein
MAGTSCSAKLDFSKISESEILADDVSSNGRAWLKADVEEKIYFLADSNTTSSSLIPGVVIKFSDGCFASLCPANQNVFNPTLLMTAQALNATAFVANGGDGESSGSSPPSQSSTSSLQDTSSVKAQSVCSADNIMSNASSSVDAASINDKGGQPAAVLPAAAVIPMKSNIRTYGPFASTNFHTSSGGIGVEVNQDLAPWVFGSTAYMIEAGNAIAQSANIGLLYGETGGVTVPGLPQYGFGQIFGATGPNLTGVSVSFGSNGITTSYDFRTFTPKFGGLTRQYIERFKMIAKYRTEQLRFLRNNQITQGKINRQIKKFNNSNRRVSGEENKPNSAKASLQRILVGGYDLNATANVERVIVGTSTLAKTAVEMMENYGNKAYMGLDAFFTPISLNGDGGLPSFTKFTKKDLLSSSNHPNPPCSVSGEMLYNLDITQFYLNPLTNPFGSGEHHHSGSGDGHSLDLVGREETVPESGLITNFYGKEDPNRYSDDYRFLGLRGPLVLQSWGYDTNGKPIPNEGDNTDRFPHNWLSSPSTWPVGPVDLRFDNDRGVWVSPQPYKVVVAKIENTLVPFSSSSGFIVTEHSESITQYSDDIYDKNGQTAQTTETSGNAKIEIIDKIGGLIPKDSLVYAYYDTFTNKYIALNSAGSSSMMKGLYSGSWDKNSSKEVTLVQFNTTVSVINKLKDIQPDTISGEQNVCYISNFGGNIYELISAECL